jgi:DNA-directed RNA polymerase subunit RPC12/RpoP
MTGWFNRKKKKFYEDKGIKFLNFFYKCGFCGHEFDVWKREDLKNCTIQCPQCKAFLPKESHIKKKMF